VTLKTSIAARNAEADAWAALLNGGSAAFYSGSQPSTADSAATGTLIATQTFGNPAFGASSSGTVTANPAAVGAVVSAGSPGYVRLKTSAGATVADMSCATSGADATINKASFAIGEAIVLIGLTYTRQTL
jgi:hypothetical protein